MLGTKAFYIVKGSKGHPIAKNSTAIRKQLRMHTIASTFQQRRLLMLQSWVQNGVLLPFAALLGNQVYAGVKVVLGQVLLGGVPTENAPELTKLLYQDMGFF